MSTSVDYAAIISMMQVNIGLHTHTHIHTHTHTHTHIHTHTHTHTHIFFKGLTMIFDCHWQFSDYYWKAIG